MVIVDNGVTKIEILSVDCLAKYIEVEHLNFMKISNKPIIVIINENGDELQIGLGYSEGIFVQFIKSNGKPPYYVSYNSKFRENEDVYVYYYKSSSYTEIMRKFLVPIREVIPMLDSFFHNRDFRFNNGWIEV